MFICTARSWHPGDNAVLFLAGFFFFPDLPRHVGEELMERRVPANGAAGGAGFLCYSQFQGQDGLRGDSSQNPAPLSDGVSHAE